jgi:aminoglycoside phosphotransferase (APT) family kinase protein
VNDTFVYTVTWTDGSGARRTSSQVLRADPEGYTNLRDHDALRQARFLERLGSMVELPVPEVLWIDEDGGPIGRPLFVMAALPGEPVPDMPPYHLQGWLHDSSEEDRRHVYRQAIDALAGVHTIDWPALGDPTLAGLPTEAAAALDRQMEEFFEFTAWGSGEDSYPTLDAAADWLRDRKPTPSGPAVLTWNDGRLGNMLFDDHRLTALLDWELVTVGPRELDLSWFLWHDQFSAEGLGSLVARRPVLQMSGAPTIAEGSAWYAAATGHQPEDLEWYLVWAAFRMAVYLMRHGRGLKESGVAEPDSAVDRVNPASVDLARRVGLEPPS